MRIIVGTKNEVKVNAVKELCPLYSSLTHAEVLASSQSSGVRDQPVSLSETIAGAKNRAEKSYAQGADLGVGIEGGLMQVPDTLTGYMNVEVCSIFDGTRHHLGLSPGFEYPPAVINAVFEQGLEISDAYREAGFTSHPRIGSAGGVIGHLTNGKLTRKEYTKLALMMALAQLENKDAFHARASVIRK